MRTVAIVAAEDLGIQMRIRDTSINEVGQWFLTTALRSFDSICIDTLLEKEPSFVLELGAKMKQLQAEEEERCLKRYIEEWESVRPLTL